MNRVPNQSYDQGFVDGLKSFAWWKDGTQHVGTTGTLLKDAIKNRKDNFYYNPPMDTKALLAQVDARLSDLAANIESDMDLTTDDILTEIGAVHNIIYGIAQSEGAFSEE